MERDVGTEGIHGGEVNDFASTETRDSVKEDERSVIDVRPELARMIEESIAALARRPELNVFCRGTALVQTHRDRATGRLFIWDMSIAAIREALDRAARFRKLVRDDFVDTYPPELVVQGVAGRGDWGLRRLGGVVEMPVLRSDGAVLDAPGYDPTSALVYEPCCSHPGVPAEPTPDEVQFALARLLDVLRDFPFVSEAGRSASVAAILSLVARPAIQGSVPLFAVRAPTPGTGKTLLVDVVALIATGRDAPRSSLATDQDEIRKSVLAIALEGARLVLLDNVEGVIKGPALEAALTGQEWSGRLLGRSQMVRMPLSTVWFLTGNGFRLGGDLPRRVALIELDSVLERPEDRIGFAYPDLRAHVRKFRGTLAVSALTLLRAFDRAGRPAHTQRPAGSFEEWDRLVRAACLWLGLADPLGDQTVMRDTADDWLEALGALLTRCTVRFSGLFTAKTLAEASRDDEDLREFLEGVVHRQSSGWMSSHDVGIALRRCQNRVVRGLRLESAGKVHGGATAWRVVRVAA